MQAFTNAIIAGITAFTVTNIDDIMILMLFFARISHVFRPRHVVVGQYLGFALLILASLPGFLGGLIIPRPWLGLLGFLPIAIGIHHLLKGEPDQQRISMMPGEWQGMKQGWRSQFVRILHPQTYQVAAVTVANGGDNIGIYVPLFASSSGQSLVVMLTVFFSLVGVWCLVAYHLTRLPMVAEMLTNYGNQLVPFVLVGLGILILLDSHTLENRGLATLTLAISGLVLLMLLRNSGRIWVASPTIDIPKLAIPPCQTSSTP
jgi:cadmium resistance transport/sequestration family protein